MSVSKFSPKSYSVTDTIGFKETLLLKSSHPKASSGVGSGQSFHDTCSSRYWSELTPALSQNGMVGHGEKEIRQSRDWRGQLREWCSAVQQHLLSSLPRGEVCYSDVTSLMSRVMSHESLIREGYRVEVLAPFGIPSSMPASLHCTVPSREPNFVVCNNLD